MTNQSHIDECLNRIEKKLNWGSNEQWTNQDFELLVDEIFKKTGTNLSLTTLKRIWGKVDYQSQPSSSTLNVLAQYLGYSHWRDFQNHLVDEPLPERPKQQPAVTRNWRSLLNRKTAFAFVVLIALSSLFFFIDRREVFFKSEEVTFSSKIVTEGLPNSVIFDYDVSKVIADSFFIQQSWDPRRRVRISPNETKHTSFYYYPGYFHAKLIANDQVIREHEVFVESDGWIAMIERFPEPIYINEYMVPEGNLLVDLDHFEQRQEHYQDRDFWIDYYFVEEMGETDGNNFEYECRIRNNSDLGSVCHESRISLICTNGRYNIPLCMPGCVSNLDLTLGDSYYSGKEHDLSPLGCDLTQWIDFKLKVADKKCEISINDSTVMTESYRMDLGRIVGIKFKFNGTGEVDNILLKDQDQSISFQEDFESIM
jgi:hypothetical protein